MTVEKLRIGQKITVIPTDQNENYFSTVYDIDDRGIYVPIPFAGNHPLVLSQGQRVHVKYMGEDSSYMFVTEAIGRKIEQDKLPMYIFKHPAEGAVQRIQMREFVRVPAMLEVQYLPLPEKDRGTVKKAYTVDISGGGMKIAVKEPVPQGSTLLVCFSLYIKAKKKQQEFRLQAAAVRCKLVDEEARVYHVGLKFLDITRAQQDLIMAFVFERMVDIKRRQ
ncbi:PilZ domain-containing protein [Desulfotomaculum varum]